MISIVSRRRHPVIRAVLLILVPLTAAGATPRTLRIVAFGDSTTAPATAWAPSIKQVYAQRLPTLLAAHGLRAEIVNAGIGDTTTRDARRRLDRDVRSHHPDMVIIQFGINDSWIDADDGRRTPRLTREEFRDNLRFIIRTLKEDGARIILMTPNPMRWADRYYIGVFSEHSGLLDTRDPRGIDRLLDLYAQDVREVARAGDVPLVDIHRAFEDYDKVPGQSVNDLLLEGDGIHPDDDGHRLVSALLAEVIVRVEPPSRGL